MFITVESDIYVNRISMNIPQLFGAMSLVLVLSDSIVWKRNNRLNNFAKKIVAKKFFAQIINYAKMSNQVEWENMRWSHFVNSSKFHLLRARSNGCSNQIVSENFVIFAYFNWTMIVFDVKPMKIAYFKQNTAIQYMHAAQMTLYLHLNDKRRKVLQLFFAIYFLNLQETYIDLYRSWRQKKNAWLKRVSSISAINCIVAWIKWITGDSWWMCLIEKIARKITHTHRERDRQKTMVDVDDIAKIRIDNWIELCCGICWIAWYAS